MLLGKIPLHTSSPSKRYYSGSYSQSLEFVSYPRIHLKRGIKNKLPFKEVLVPGQSVCYRNKLVFSSSSDDLHPISQVLKPIFNLISWSRFIFFNFILTSDSAHLPSQRTKAICSSYHCFKNKIKCRNQSK